MAQPRTSAVVETVMREDWGRLLAVLIAGLRDFQLAEDCLSDAFSRALEHWPRGVPDNPQGWLLQTARRRAIDRLRREKSFRAKAGDIARLMELDAMDRPEPQDIPDERLRLIFTACHPALERKTQVALTLRTLCGLTTSEIARAFLDSKEALAQRLVRARHKIKSAGIPFEVPEPDAWPERLDSVLTVIYLIFNEGFAASSGATLTRVDLCEDAIGLARVMDALRPDEPAIMGLLALMLLSHARSPARATGRLGYVPLESQDRNLWDHDRIAEGLRLVETALRLGRPERFQLQAAISAVHSEAADFASTRWTEIVLIYKRLCEIDDTPVTRLNRAVAVSFAAGPEAALPEVVSLGADLSGYHAYHAALADIYRRTGSPDKAATAYSAAIGLCENVGERGFLQARYNRTKKEAEQKLGPSPTGRMK